MPCLNSIALKLMLRIFSRKYYSFLFLLTICLSLNLSAQPVLSTKSKKAAELYAEADNYRVRGQFTQAIDLLNEALERDSKFVEAYYRLGIVYMSMRNFPEAIKAFEKGLTLTNDVKKQKVFWFDLAESYFTIGNYDQADKTISDFLAAETLNKQKVERAKSLQSNIRFARDNVNKASSYQQRPLSDTVNKFVMQYFPVLTADQQSLIFTRRLGFTDEHDEDLVVSRKDNSGRWQAPESLSKNINTMFNEGTCTISADGRKLIFTSCTGREGFGSCDLFESERIGNDWTIPVNLGPLVNSAEWESQPSLSADGRTLYFVSDRRGGVGRRDIWSTTLGADGKWTKAKNIGKPVNTVYDEISPFIHVNNQTLYFASKGLTGFGGYDLYFSERDSSRWSPPVNVGAPINNHEDQFSLFITADGLKGYYSHEELKQGGNGESKIYEIEIPESNRVKYRSNYVKGVVSDKQTGKPLKTNVELIDISTNETQSLVTSDSVTGEYLIVLTQGAEYALYVNKAGYLFKSLNFNYSEVKDFEPITLNIELERVREGSKSVLENIFFETDKYELTGKSIVELNRLIRFLNENKNTRIEISGHTDNVGSDLYNLDLSEKRANAVYQYLISKGIDKARLTAKGFGSKYPISTNETDNGRMQNRRIEFKLIGRQP
jgi:OmpA-OmpF porin, OOP family